MGAQLTSGSCDPDFDAVAASGLCTWKRCGRPAAEFFILRGSSRRAVALCPAHAGCRDPRRVRASLEEVRVWLVHSE